MADVTPVTLLFAFHLPFSGIDVLMSAGVGVAMLVGAIALRRLARSSADPAQFAPAQPLHAAEPTHAAEPEAAAGESVTAARAVS
jgi:hypothetical protein